MLSKKREVYNGGIRPILNTSSYYSNKQEYLDDLSDSHLRYYETLIENDYIINFFTKDTNVHFASFNRYEGSLRLHCGNSAIIFAPKRIVSNSPIVLIYTL